MNYIDYDFDINDYITADYSGWFGTDNNNSCAYNYGNSYSYPYGCYGNSGAGACCNTGNIYNCGCGCQCPYNAGNTLSPGICSQTLNNVVIDGSVNSRIVIVPVTIQNLVNNKEFIVWVTVYANTINGPVVVGQDYRIVCNPGCPGCANYTFEMPIAICAPICDSANLSASVNGNYVCICGGLTNC